MSNEVSDEVSDDWAADEVVIWALVIEGGYYWVVAIRCEKIVRKGQFWSVLVSFGSIFSS